MARLGYGLLLPEQFVSFKKELTQGEWKSVSPGHSKKAEVPVHKTPVLVFFKEVLAHAIDQVVVAQSAANDVEGAEPRWSQAERRFVGKVQLLMLNEDPAVVASAGQVLTVLCDGGSMAMINRSADGKVDFGSNQLAVALTPEMAPLIESLGLQKELDDVRVRTDDLAAAIGRGDVSNERLSRGKRIERATAACTAAFNWVHEGLATMGERSDDAATRAELDAMLAPFEALLARRPADAVAVVAAPVPAPVLVSVPANETAQPPLAHTG